MSDALTLLFTDVEGSRALATQSPEGAARALAVQDVLVRACVSRHGGRVTEQTGDGLYAVLPSAHAAALAAVEAQRAILDTPWPEVGPVRVRMALHAVADAEADSPQAARRCGHLLSIGHGGQILLTGPTARLLQHEMPDGVSTWMIGRRQRHPLAIPEEVHQILRADIPATFPPPTSLWPRRWRRWHEQLTTAVRRAIGARAARHAPSTVATGQ